jgi:outer membrane protein OmpA-like peptidoglycan-associated protein
LTQVADKSGGGSDGHEGEGEREVARAYFPEAAPVAAVVPPEPLKYVVYFDFDKAALGPTTKVVLAEACAAADKLVGAITIAGNADKAGADNHNQVLSELRADAVAKAMMAQGIPAKAIQISAYGEKPGGDDA